MDKSAMYYYDPVTRTVEADWKTGPGYFQALKRWFHMRIMLALAFGVLLTRILSAESIDDVDTKKAEFYYNSLVPKLAPTNVPFADQYKRPFALQINDVRLGRHGCLSDVLKVDGQFKIWVNVRSGSLLHIRNDTLGKFIETNDVQRVPSLSVTEAVRTGKRFLDVIGVQLPSGMALDSVSFNDDHRKSCWKIVWVLSADGYRPDEFVHDYDFSMGVSFHERYGFVGYTRFNVVPPPKTTKVLVAQDKAIEKVEKTIPLVLRTPCFQMVHSGEYKAIGMTKAELRVCVPNWLLDPGRAVWLPDCDPVESRLCWTVGVSVVEPYMKNGLEALPVEIMFYVDSFTGDIVGVYF